MTGTPINRALSRALEDLKGVGALDDVAALVDVSTRTLYRHANPNAKKRPKALDPAGGRRIMDLLGSLGLLEDYSPATLYAAAGELRRLADAQRATASAVTPSQEGRAKTDGRDGGGHGGDGSPEARPA